MATGWVKQYEDVLFTRKSLSFPHFPEILAIRN